MLFGLRADEEWVRTVAQDPSAEYAPIPLLPAERATLINELHLVGDTTEKLKAYGRRFPEAFAGVIVSGPTAVIQLSRDLDLHRQALSEVMDGAPYDVRGVPYSLVQLEAFAKRVEYDRDWFNRRDIDLLAADVSPLHNVVTIRYLGPRVAEPGPELAAERAMVAHYGDWAVAEWSGPLPWTGPRGELHVDVRGSGADVAHIYCHAIPLDPDAGEGNIYTKPSARGRCTFRSMPAVRYAVTITTSGPERTELASRTVVEVESGRTSEVRIAPWR